MLNHIHVASFGACILMYCQIFSKIHQSANLYPNRIILYVPKLFYILWVSWVQIFYNSPRVKLFPKFSGWNSCFVCLNPSRPGLSWPGLGAEAAWSGRGVLEDRGQRMFDVFMWCSGVINDDVMEIDMEICIFIIIMIIIIIYFMIFYVCIYKVTIVTIRMIIYIDL